MEIYKPAEDSQLLAAAVKKYAYGSVLDVGTGSGIHAIMAAKNKEVKSVVAVDINDEALKFGDADAAKKGVKGKIKFTKSDLFSGISARERFDTIIFNPPYLPQDKGISDEAIYGGKHGYELLLRFISSCSCGSYLKDKGVILTVFSSRTNKQKIDEAIEKNCLEFEELEQKHLFFETLYVYLIRKSQLLLQLQQRGIKNVKLFEKGNRGVLYRCSYKGKTVVVKAKRRESAAVARIENEIVWLKKLNKKGIGPKLLFSSKEKDWFAYEFVKGKFILDFIGSCGNDEKGKLKVKEAIKQLLLQCRKLDELKINKEEMSRPQKHVILDGYGEITMIDFERSRKTLKPKNVTQLCQFLTGAYANSLLQQKGVSIDKEKLIAAAKQYKHAQNRENFKRILNLI